MGVKAGVKLAYKSVFPPIFTWDFLNSYNNCYKVFTGNK